MKVWLDTKLMFHDAENGFREYQLGTKAETVTREGIKDPNERRIILEIVERIKAKDEKLPEKERERPVVIRLDGRLRVVARSAVVTEEQLEKRKRGT